MEQLKLKFNTVQQICNRINSITNLLSVNKILFFSEITVKVKFSSAELCFNSLISWLYILFHEASGRNLMFIDKKINSYQIQLTDRGAQSKKIVHSFRTILQHQMDFINKPSDIEKLNLCISWHQSLIRKNEPENEDEWKICINELLDSVIEYLDGINSCLTTISENEHFDIVVTEWTKLFLRDYTSYDFEKVLTKALKNLGLDGYLDAAKLTKKHINSWRSELDPLPDDFDFEIHAYKITERSLLKKDIIPIDANDIISLGVSPGPQIGELISKAKQLFYEKPCSKEELIELIKEAISDLS